MRFFKNFGLGLFLASKLLYKEDYIYRASALAFSTILSLVPLLAVFIALFSFSSLFTQSIISIQSFLIANFLPSSISVINNYLHDFINQSTKLPTASILFLVVTIISLFLTVRDTFNYIWRNSHSQNKRSGVLYWLALILVTIISSVIVFIGPYTLSLPWISNWLNYGEIKIYLISIISFAINIIIFSILYIFIPNYKIRFLEGLKGAILAAFIFEIIKSGFGFYISRFSSYGFVYGALAVIPVFFLWIYLSWLIILYGAIFVYTQSESTVLKE